MSQSELSDFNLEVKWEVKWRVLRGFGCDSCLESVKLLVGGHCDERVRESRGEQRQLFNFHLSLRWLFASSLTQSHFHSGLVPLANWELCPVLTLHMKSVFRTRITCWHATVVTSRVRSSWFVSEDWLRLPQMWSFDMAAAWSLSLTWRYVGTVENNIRLIQLSDLHTHTHTHTLTHTHRLLTAHTFLITHLYSLIR